MDRHKIDDVAGFAPVGGGGCFIRGEVHGVEHITEKLIPLGGEESKGAVGDPFKLHGLAKTFGLRLPVATLNFPP